MNAYTDQVPACREQVARLEAKWKERRDQAQTDHKRPPKKPELPMLPKRLLKPKYNGGPLKSYKCALKDFCSKEELNT